MKIYEHNGVGHYIGSHIVVLAKSKKTAVKMIRKELDESGLENEEIDDITTHLLDKPKVISSEDGDY